MIILRNKNYSNIRGAIKGGLIGAGIGAGLGLMASKGRIGGAVAGGAIGGFMGAEIGNQTLSPKEKAEIEKALQNVPIWVKEKIEEINKKIDNANESLSKKYSRYQSGLCDFFWIPKIYYSPGFVRFGMKFDPNKVFIADVDINGDNGYTYRWIDPFTISIDSTNDTLFCEKGKKKVIIKSPSQFHQLIKSSYLIISSSKEVIEDVYRDSEEEMSWYEITPEIVEKYIRDINYFIKTL